MQDMDEFLDLQLMICKFWVTHARGIYITSIINCEFLHFQRILMSDKQFFTKSIDEIDIICDIHRN